MAHFNDSDYLYREKIRRLLKKIDRDCDAVIVEGRNDKKVLERMGVSTRVFMFSRRNIEEFCDTVSRCSDTVAVLTDFDTAGKQLNRDIVQELVEDVDVMNSYRKEFGKLLTSEDRFCIEDLSPLLGKEFDRFDEAKLDRLYTDLG